MWRAERPRRSSPRADAIGLRFSARHPLILRRAKGPPRRIGDSSLTCPRAGTRGEALNLAWAAQQTPSLPLTRRESERSSGGWSGGHCGRRGAARNSKPPTPTSRKAKSDLPTRGRYEESRAPFSLSPCGRARLRFAKSVRGQRLCLMSGRGAMRHCLQRGLRHIRKQRAEPLGHGRMREDGLAHGRVRHPCQHRGLHHRHDLTRLRADHGEA